MQDTTASLRAPGLAVVLLRGCEIVAKGLVRRRVAVPRAQPLPAAGSSTM
jgi:hypothetical protein